MINKFLKVIEKRGEFIFTIFAIVVCIVKYLSFLADVTFGKVGVFSIVLNHRHLAAIMLIECILLLILTKTSKAYFYPIISGFYGSLVWFYSWIETTNGFNYLWVASLIPMIQGGIFAILVWFVGKLKRAKFDVTKS